MFKVAAYVDNYTFYSPFGNTSSVSDYFHLFHSTISFEESSNICLIHLKETKS